MVWTLAFAWSAHIHLPLWLLTVVALAAWCVYIGDRLLDAHQARTPLRARHKFHWAHRRVFIPIAVAAAVIDLALVVHSMPFATRERDSILAAAALAYFTSVHSPWSTATSKFRVRLPKELLVGILFTVSCVTPALTRMNGLRWDLLLAIVCFTALAWLNCHAIESWESSPSPTQHSEIFRLAAGLSGIALLAAIIAASTHEPRQAALLCAASISAALLALLDHYRWNFTPIALRVAADLVLLTPIAFLARS